MRIKLTQPLPQIGRVIPAGVYIEDAPFAFKDRLVKQGKAVWAFDDDQGDGCESVPDSPISPTEPEEPSGANFEETQVPEAEAESENQEQSPSKGDKPVSRRKKGAKASD